MKLTWGDLPLTLYPYSIQFGSDYGAPQNVTQALAMLLQDGEIELSSRTSNRTIQFNVLVDGTDLADCAANEAALVLEADKPLNTLSLDPEDDGPVTVYDTFRAQVTHARDEAGELMRLRIYTVTVNAAPAGRSADRTSVAGTAPGGSTTTSLDTCGATTGWTSTVDGVAGSVTHDAGPPTTNAVSSGSVTGSHTLTLTKTFAATTSTTNLLMVDWLPFPVLGSSLQATGDGVLLPKVAEAASPTAGYTRTWFRVAASSLAVTTLTMVSSRASSIGGGVRTLRVDGLAVTNVQPISGSNRQQIKALEVEGSMRTPASLAIESATAALGDDALVYVYPADESTSGYLPALRPFRSSGNSVTSDAALVSGARETLASPGVTYDVPIVQFPRGSCVLMVRVGVASGSLTDSITATCNTKIGSNSVNVQSLPAVEVSVDDTAYQTFVIGRLNLPTVDLDPSSPASLELTLNAGLASTLIIDEAWLFNTSIGRLTWIDCGTGAGSAGANSRRLFIEPATVETPRPTIRVGHSADRSDSYYVTPKSWQPPEFKPGQVSVLAVTPNATDATVSLDYYARWHTHAAS